MVRQHSINYDSKKDPKMVADSNLIFLQKLFVKKPVDPIKLIRKTPFYRNGYDDQKRNPVLPVGCKNIELVS